MNVNILTHDKSERVIHLKGASSFALTPTDYTSALTSRSVLRAAELFTTLRISLWLSLSFSRIDFQLQALKIISLLKGWIFIISENLIKCLVGDILKLKIEQKLIIQLVNSFHWINLQQLLALKLQIEHHISAKYKSLFLNVLLYKSWFKNDFLVT